MTISWSEEAVLSYKETIDVILESWSIDIFERFIEKLNTLFKKLKSHKILCPKSVISNLRKRIIPKQTSLIYRIKSDNLIEIILFINIRNKHKYQ